MKGIYVQPEFRRMKNNPLSLLSLFFIALALILIRIFYWHEAHHIFTWDSLGYYLYLPSHFIYHDVSHLKWFPEIAKAYQLPGNFYQASMQPNGNYVFFYSMGVAIIQLPFFFIGHWCAGALGYAQDGFSAPYQISVCIGMIFYSVVGLCFLRSVLLHYFSDAIAASVLLLVTLATNYLQYTAVDGGFTHGYLFAVFCVLLFFSVKWHSIPSLTNSFAIGFLVGLTVVIRVTDLLVILVPIFWNTSTKELRTEKWKLIRSNKKFLLTAIIGGFLPLIPQLIYWKAVTGKWIHQMGSKWDFLLPHFQVLVGFEKGWFIYTPVTLLMVAGLFFMREKNFRRGVLIYFLLNVWLVCAWHMWRYGGSYSARALMQSMAVMALPLGTFIERFSKGKMKWLILVVGIYLCVVNVFQIWQYNKTIIHYNDMNAKYYAVVYLNPSPSPIDMSLLDTDERLKNENDFKMLNEIKSDSIRTINFSSDSSTIFLNEKISDLLKEKKSNEAWLKLSVEVKSEWGAHDSYFTAAISHSGKTIKERNIRMQNGICIQHEWNKIEYWFSIPENTNDDELKIFCHTHAWQNILLRNFSLRLYSK